MGSCTVYYCWEAYRWVGADNFLGEGNEQSVLVYICLSSLGMRAQIIYPHVFHQDNASVLGSLRNIVVITSTSWSAPSFWRRTEHLSSLMDQMDRMDRVVWNPDVDGIWGSLANFIHMTTRICMQNKLNVLQTVAWFLHPLTVRAYEYACVRSYACVWLCTRIRMCMHGRMLLPMLCECDRLFLVLSADMAIHQQLRWRGHTRPAHAGRLGCHVRLHLRWRRRRGRGRVWGWWWAWWAWRRGNNSRRAVYDMHPIHSVDNYGSAKMNE